MHVGTYVKSLDFCVSAIGYLIPISQFSLLGFVLWAKEVVFFKTEHASQLATDSSSSRYNLWHKHNDNKRKTNNEVCGIFYFIYFQARE